MKFTAIIRKIINATTNKTQNTNNKFQIRIYYFKIKRALKNKALDHPENRCV